MESVDLTKVSDVELKHAFVDRFCIKPGQPIRSSAGVVDYLQSLLINNADKEQFLVIFLNGQNCVIDTQTMFEGTLTQAAVYPREVIKAALEKRSAACVLAHNHPSGNINPSAEDQAVTRKIKAALDTVDIRLLDHVIIGYGSVEYYSFADRGLLNP